MDLFISWSGQRSGAAAEALRAWIPKIINAVKPWLASADIDKGARWGSDIATRLESSRAGIICLTPSNLHSDWILFEAGALSKSLQNAFVCPLLIDLDPADLKGPLAQFQATRAMKEDILKLLRTLNVALGDSALPEVHIEEAFEVWWPKLDAQLKNLPSEEGATKPYRSERDLLEEILALARNQTRSPNQPVVGRNVRLVRRVREKVMHDEVLKMVTRFGIEAQDQIASMDTLDSEESLVFVIRTDKGSGFKIEVPYELSVAEIAACVKSQIPIVSTGSIGLDATK